jgi:hypothetical protein
MSANDIMPPASHGAKGRAAGARAARRPEAWRAGGAAAREARERRRTLAEIAAMLRRNPFLEAEV